MADIVHARKIIKEAVIIAVCVACTLLLRLSLDQWQSYSKGTEELKKSNYSNAVMCYDRVLNAHIPFSPLENKAERNLLALGAKFEKEKEYELALLCYETIRTSRYLTRHFFIPGASRIPYLNSRIAAIKAGALVRDGLVRDYKEGYDQQMGIMSKDFSPSVFWSLITVAAFWAYIGFIILWILKRKPAYVFVFCVAFIVWLTGLYMA